MGTTTATFQRWRSERRKAGITVIAGKGQRIVGAFEKKSPIEAGINNANPAIPVSTALLDTGVI